MKKTPNKNTNNKKTKQTNKSTSKILSLVNILVVLTTIALAIVSYIFLVENSTQTALETKIINTIVNKHIEPKDKFEEKTKALEIEYVNNIDNASYIEIKDEDKIKKDLFKEIINTIEQPVQPKKNKIETTDKKQKQKQKKVVNTNLPKLAIIIDDVTTSSQIRKIQSIDYDVNMAFLPPNKSHVNSAKITHNLTNYMIHLPLQASNNRFDEKKTLHINDSISKIENRINEVKRLYPKAKFINNHTGSKFTANKHAMDKLLHVLKKHNYTFIDSRTTAKSVVLQSAKKYGIRVLSRNIFLDNKKDKRYIQKQLLKAVKIAKRNGSAIAIGHPHSITLKTLKESKHLLKGVELVYVNKL